MEQEGDVFVIALQAKLFIIVTVRPSANIILVLQLAIANHIERSVHFIQKNVSTLLLGLSLLILSALSLFVGVIDIDWNTLMSGGNSIELKIFLLARVPRLLAILCTGVGMSVAGLIMQQLCMNKFVSPSTGATIQSAQGVTDLLKQLFSENIT